MKKAEEVETEVETPAEEEVVETPAEEEEVVEAGAEEEVETPAEGEPSTTEEVVAEEKAVSLGDLKKFSEDLIAKLGDHTETSFQKALGELTDKVEKSVTALTDRVKALEAQPASSKVKASFVDVEKGEGAEKKSDMSEADVKELLKRRDNLAANPGQGTMDERIALTTDLRRARAAGHSID